MRALRLRFLAVFLLFLLVGLSVLVSDFPFPPPPGPPPGAPRAVVALGDSTMSGEGGGDYEAGTRGENGDWCHRSPNAAIHDVVVPGVHTVINLACSGATAEDVALGDHVHYTEGSQARQLAEVARRYRVVAVVIAVGANDDPRFGDAVNACAQAGLRNGSPGCSSQLRTEWPARVTRMVPKVVHALLDVRSTMDKAGYPAGSYALVLQTYAAPVGPDVAPSLQGLAGCPFRTGDLAWMSSDAVTQLDDGLRVAATLSGARLLDLSRAGTGHGACSGGQNADSEWFTRLTIDWNALQDDARYQHAMQESFHPNARGYAQIGHCLSAFLATSAASGSCVPDSDGTLHLSLSPSR